MQEDTLCDVNDIFLSGMAMLRYQWLYITLHYGTNDIVFSALVCISLNLQLVLKFSIFSSLSMILQDIQELYEKILWSKINVWSKIFGAN